MWKKTDELPVPKAHPPTSIESDIRPISLTPTISKILESIIRSWILEIVDSQLDDHQFGGPRLTRWWTCYTTEIERYRLHLLLTDFDQQSRFQYFTYRCTDCLFHKFLFTVCTNQFSIGLFQFYFICIYA